MFRLALCAAVATVCVASVSAAAEPCSGGRVWNDCGSPCTPDCGNPYPMCAAMVRVRPPVRVEGEGIAWCRRRAAATVWRMCGMVGVQCMCNGCALIPFRLFFCLCRRSPSSLLSASVSSEV